MTLVCRDLVVEYTGAGRVVRPIDGLTLDIGRGELALVLGASGCGKTTLLSVLAGMLSPASGSVWLGDVEVTRLAGGALGEYRRRKVGVVFQAFNLIPSLTAAENVQVPMRAAGAGGRTARRRADELLAKLGLRDRRSHRPGQLSGGEQQRVAIARALALDPPLVVADEPTAHLDTAQVEGLLGLLREIADAGHVVVVATHDERMLSHADQLIAMGACPRAKRTADPVRLAPSGPLVRAPVADLA